MFNKRPILFKPVFKKTKNLNIIAILSNYFYLDKKYLDFFFYKLYKKKAKMLNKKCIMLIKRKNFFTVFHIYINNKLIYISDYEIFYKKLKYYTFEYLYILLKIKKIMLKYKNKFNEIILIVKFVKVTPKKRGRVNKYKKNPKKNKVKRRMTRTLISSFLLRRFIRYTYWSKKLKIKYVYNMSHSRPTEKLKKKRRK